MQLTQAIDKYKVAKHFVFNWRDELSISYRIGLSLVFACITGLSAQIRIPLPFTPVPATGQVFAVLLSGIILGGYYGGLSQIFYVMLGIMGLPWFTGWNGGLGIITGVTGGYIIGFIPAALIIGWLTDRYIHFRRFYHQLLIMGFGVGIIYIFGAIQFSMVMNTGFFQTIKMAILPFIAVDLIKGVLASGVSTGVLPKK
jgi:biotin transport system substrate-specific component